MIIKYELSSSASSTMRYTARNPTNEQVYSSFGYGDTKYQVQSLNEISQLGNRTSLKKNFIHLSVSLHPTDQKSKIELAMITRCVIRELFSDQAQPLFFVIYSHSDKAHLHSHAIISRVSFDKNIQQNVSYKTIKAVARKFEKTFGLTQVNQAKSEKRRNNKIAHAELYGYKNELAQLWPKLDLALRNVNLCLSTRKNWQPTTLIAASGLKGRF